MLRDRQRLLHILGQFSFVIQEQAFLLLQGIETLSLRLERHAENTKKVVEFLKNHSQVEKVNHPSLPSHPDYFFYQKYFPNGGASIFTFDIKGGKKHIGLLITCKFSHCLQM